MKKCNNKCTRLLKIINAFLFSICIILCGICFDYENVYAKTLENNQDKVSSSIESNYTLTLIERGNIKENIKGSDIGLKKNGGVTFD